MALQRCRCQPNCVYGQFTNADWFFATCLRCSTPGHDRASGELREYQYGRIRHGDGTGCHQKPDYSNAATNPHLRDRDACAECCYGYLFKIIPRVAAWLCVGTAGRNRERLDDLVKPPFGIAALPFKYPAVV